jgi:hypothetical protein
VIRECKGIRPTLGARACGDESARVIGDAALVHRAEAEGAR